MTARSVLWAHWAFAVVLIGGVALLIVNHDATAMNPFHHLLGIALAVALALGWLVAVWGFQRDASRQREVLANLGSDHGCRCRWCGAVGEAEDGKAA